MTAMMAEIRLFPFGFAPRGWLPCNGAVLPIAQNQALFALLGTQYGGNGVQTFALPNLQQRSPVHAGDRYTVGEAGGTSAHALTTPELPSHAHTPLATSAAAGTGAPAAADWATTTRPHYGTSPQVAMAPGTVGPVGGSAPHPNMPPYLGLQYAIATAGIFPSRDGSSSDDNFLGEIRFFAGNFAPGGWAACNGQLMAISQNTALFALLGTYYGGDGRVTYALPDLQGATPVHVGTQPGGEEYVIGQTGGAETVTLTSSTMPAHTHTAQTVPAGTTGTSGNPSGAAWATPVQGRLREPLYATGGTPVAMSDGALAPTGGGLPHENRSPYLAMTAVIALQGIFPQRP